MDQVESLKKKLNISQKKKTCRLNKKVSSLMTVWVKKKTLSVVIVLIFWKKLFMELLEGAKGGGGRITFHERKNSHFTGKKLVISRDLMNSFLTV